MDIQFLISRSEDYLMNAEEAYHGEQWDQAAAAAAIAAAFSSEAVARRGL